MQINRHKFIDGLLEEQKLRAIIRKGIGIILEKRKQNSKLLREELQLKQIVRKLIKEATKKNIKQHDSTGMNALEVLVTSTNFLDELKGEYILLRTNIEQRDSFKQHIMNAIENMFARDELNREPDEEEREREEEKPESNVGISPETASDVEDQNDIVAQISEALSALNEQETSSAAKSTFAVLPDMERTGAIRAKSAWNKVEELLISALSGLPLEEDRQTFKKYMLLNFTGAPHPETGKWVPGYFEQWEAEISGVTPEAPAA